MPSMTTHELDRFIQEHYPIRPPWRIAQVGEGSLELRLACRDDYLRPGGTIAGPVLMALADNAAYLVILSMIGPVVLAVTTSLNINFVRKPSPEELSARAHVLKLGRQLAVVDVHIVLAASDVLVAQATVTYSIPPTKTAT
jgi:uncharacterized protein (TIGR00369 family)